MIIDSLTEEFAAVKREIQDSTIDTDAFTEMKLQLLESKENHSKLSDVLKQKSDFEKIFLASVRQRNEDLNEAFRRYQEEAQKINNAQNELKIEIGFKGDKDSFKARIKTDFRGTGISDTKYSLISTSFSDYVDIIAEIVLYDGKRLKELLSSAEYLKFCEKMAENYKDLIQYIVPDKVEIFYHEKLLRKSKDFSLVKKGIKNQAWDLAYICTWSTVYSKETDSQCFMFATDDVTQKVIIVNTIPPGECIKALYSIFTTKKEKEMLDILFESKFGKSRIQPMKELNDDEKVKNIKAIISEEYGLLQNMIQE